MVKISMAVEASSHEELLEALKNAGPNVYSFYGEVKTQADVPSTPTVETTEEPAADEPAQEDTPEEPTPVYSKDEVRAELRKVLHTQGSDVMKDILRKYGSEKLDGVDESHYPAIVAEVQEVLASAS